MYADDLAFRVVAARAHACEQMTQMARWTLWLLGEGLFIPVSVAANTDKGKSAHVASDEATDRAISPSMRELGKAGADTAKWLGQDFAAGRKPKKRTHESRPHKSAHRWINGNQFKKKGIRVTGLVTQCFVPSASFALAPLSTPSDVLPAIFLTIADACTVAIYPSCATCT